ncbi:hypothetical protein DEI95_04220 [Curtobacterium sp. MCBD17_008]|nr:hypothetical protein DEI95_04220 [Curtobacterium sp. MCBD17_008]
MRVGRRHGEEARDEGGARRRAASGAVGNGGGRAPAWTGAGVDGVGPTGATDTTGGGGGHVLRRPRTPGRYVLHLGVS